MTQTIKVRVTAAEARVMRELLVDGAPGPVLAKRLHLSAATVHTHLHNVMKKTGALSRAELAVAVLRGRVQLVVRARSAAVVAEGAQ